MSDAGRVIAGTARGTRLAAPGEGTRPFGDRVKQTLFAILEPDLPDARVLDLFAGSGAGGIEALSRGAACAVFVERDAIAGRVARADVLTYLADRAAADGPFDLVLIDPPYAEFKLLESALARLAAPPAPLLTAAVWVVAKHFWRTPPPSAVGLLASVRTRRFGETGLTFYRRTGAEPPVAEESVAVAPDRPAAETEEAAR
jgi:16S rRNA (guanine966-N2)-methyltransferase